MQYVIVTRERLVDGTEAWEIVGAIREPDLFAAGELAKIVNRGLAEPRQRAWVLPEEKWSLEIGEFGEYADVVLAEYERLKLEDEES